MSRKEEILEDKVYTVGGKLVENLDAPNGIVLPEEIEAYKKEFFRFIIGHLADEVVDVKKSYPKKDTMDITYSSEFIVMRKKDFNELINL